MAAPTAEEILELYEDLNFPSATKLRAALLKKGYKARIKDVETFIKSQTPTQLFAKAPKYRGKVIASRPNERWVVDFIDFSAEPSGEYKYILLVQDIFSRKLWATAMFEKKASEYIDHMKSMFIDYGKPQEINADGEFNIPAFNQFLARNSVTARYKEGRQDLATLDAAMNNFKKMLKKQMQEKGTNDWKTLLPKATRAHNRLAHEALMGNEPNEAYEGENKALQFELREEAGNKMKQQNAVVVQNQKNIQENGGFRTYIGREDLRRRGDRPQYSGDVRLVAAVEGNRAKDESGNTHSLTLAKPVPADSSSTDIRVRTTGSTQTEGRRRTQMSTHADALKNILVDRGAMSMSEAAIQVTKDSPGFKRDKGNLTFKQFLELFPKMFVTQTGASGGMSRVSLKRTRS